MKTIRAEDIPADLSAVEFLRSLDLSEEVVVESKGAPRIVLMSAQSVQQRREAKDRLFLLIDNIRREHPDTDADAILAELEDHDHLERARQ